MQAKGRKNANFVGDSGKEMSIIKTIEYIKAAKEKFYSYGDEWIKAYFDEESGGFNVYHKRHLFTALGGGGDAEKIVGQMLAKYSGKQIEFLPEGGKKKPDILFDNQTWEIKKITEANEETIRTYIKNGRKADNEIFYWEGKNDKLEMLISAIGRSKGYFIKKKELYTMPNIYFIDHGKLKLLWSK